MNIRVLDSVVGFTVAEMNRNKHDTKIRQCRALNEEAEDLTHRAARKKEEAGLSNPAAYAEALALAAQAASKFKEALGIFYEVETTGALWDHKTRIAKVWGHVNRLGDSEDTYYYDIWSNLHFGYVGHAAGFNLLTLAVGSDVQNFIDHFRPDEPADKSSSAEGYNLYRRGRDVTIEDLLGIVARHPEWRYAARTAK